MKRVFRQASTETRQKMSKAHTGKKLSQHTRNLISQALTDYWKTIPNEPQIITMDEYLGSDEEI